MSFDQTSYEVPPGSCTMTTLGPKTGLFHLPQDFKLCHGGVLRSAVLSFELRGAKEAPIVLVQGGISSDRHVFRSTDDESGVAGWYDAQVGPGRAIDTDTYRILGIDWLGGAKGSTGPSTTDQRPFPAVTSADQAAATALLLEHLQIPRLHAFVGASYGAMVGLCLASQSPTLLERLIAISGAHGADPMSTAWRSLQRRILRLGLTHGAGLEAAAIARGLAMTTYRSRAEFADRFESTPTGIADGCARFPVEDYLEARGLAYATTIDPEAFFQLSQAIDLHVVDPTTIRTQTTVVGVPSDQLVPFEQSQELFSGLAGQKEFVALDSITGHDAFLTETEALSVILQRALAAPVVTGRLVR